VTAEQDGSAHRLRAYATGFGGDVSVAAADRVPDSADA
jgi:hypothetical protein